MELLQPFPLYLVFASITAEYHLTRKSCACIYACLVHALMHILVHALVNVLVPLKNKIRQSRTTCSYFCWRKIKNRDGLACNPDKMEVDHPCSCFHSITLPGID